MGNIEVFLGVRSVHLHCLLRPLLCPAHHQNSCRDKTYRTS